MSRDFAAFVDAVEHSFGIQVPSAPWVHTVADLAELVAHQIDHRQCGSRAAWIAQERAVVARIFAEHRAPARRAQAIERHYRVATPPFRRPPLVVGVILLSGAGAALHVAWRFLPAVSRPLDRLGILAVALGAGLLVLKVAWRMSRGLRTRPDQVLLDEDVALAYLADVCYGAEDEAVPATVPVPGILERLRAIIAELLAVRLELVRPESRLREDLRLC